MKNKMFLILASLVLLSGCSNTSSKQEESSSTPTTYTIEQLHETGGAGVVGFVTATTCYEGIISLDDTLTFNVFYGRARETIHPEIYDKHKDSNFYLEELIAWDYHDKRGESEVYCFPKSIHNVAKIDLPDLMEEEYVFEKKNPVLTHFVTVSLDLKPYHDYFYDAEGICASIDNPNYEIEEPMDVELEKTDFFISFSIYASNNNKDIDCCSYEHSYPKAELENEVLTMKLCHPTLLSPDCAE